MRTRAPADTKPNDEPWSQKELLRFQPVAEQEEWAACWRLTLCGLRRSEVTGLRWVVAARVRADDLQAPRPRRKFVCRHPLMLLQRTGCAPARPANHATA
jgi:hypothetical protein